jgi:hypothetical protein
MLKVQNPLDMQLVFACAAVLCDPVDQHCHFWNRRIHAVAQAEFEGHRYLREALRPVRLDLAVLDLLRACDDFSQPLALYCCRDPVVSRRVYDPSVPYVERWSRMQVYEGWLDIDQLPKLGDIVQVNFERAPRARWFEPLKVALRRAGTPIQAIASPSSCPRTPPRP